MEYEYLKTDGIIGDPMIAIVINDRLFGMHLHTSKTEHFEVHLIGSISL